VTITKHHQVPVSDATWKMLERLSSETGESMLTIVERAVRQFQHQQWFKQAERAWDNLERDPAALAAWQAEFDQWDTTIADGLEPEEW
jgi:predicted transcriptional regulator